MRLLRVLSLLLAAALAARADTTIQKKDGTAQVAKALRRDKDNIIATIDIQPAKAGDPVQQGDVGIPIAQIAKIEFGEPAALKTAPDLLIQGKGADAMAQIDQALKYYEGFRDALMETSARTPQQRVVGSVLDEGVFEDVARCPTEATPVDQP